MGSVKLSIDEVLVMKDEGVGRCTGSMGVLKAIASGGIERGILILTNKALIFCARFKAALQEEGRRSHSARVNQGIERHRADSPCKTRRS